MTTPPSRALVPGWVTEAFVRAHARTYASPARTPPTHARTLARTLWGGGLQGSASYVLPPARRFPAELMLSKLRDMESW